MGFGPQLVDFNGNGRLDIISGSFPGEIYLFPRQDDGTYAAPEKLKDQNGELVKVGSASAVFAHDWDNDKDLDLIVGNIRGEVYFIPNEGTRTEPAWAKAQQLQAGGQTVQVPRGDAGPAIADWNGDGKDDLLVGCGDGSVLWYRNTGSAEKPELDQAVPLLQQGKRVALSPSDGQQQKQADKNADENPVGRFLANLITGGTHKSPNSSDTLDDELHPELRTKICITDWNEDGRLDLLVGDFNRSKVKTKELTHEEKKTRNELQQEWSKLADEYLKLLREKPEVTEEAEKKKLDEQIAKAKSRMQELQQELAKYQTERYEYHGWVWLFLRNEIPRIATQPDGGS